MTNQFPAEVIEVVTGAARMMIEDGVTVDQFKSDIERMTRVYIESYIERQRKMCMDYLTSTTTRDAALNILLGMMKAQSGLFFTLSPVLERPSRLSNTR